MANQIISGIDNGSIDENYFQNETLFINIYYCFYFIKFLSPYYT